MFIGAIQQVLHLERRVDKESNKKWHRRDGMQSKKGCLLHIFPLFFFVTQSLFLLGSSESSDNITKSNKKSTSKAYQCIWNNFIIFAQKYYSFITLSSGLFIDTCVPKNSIKIWISTSFDIAWYAEAAIYAKNLLFSHSVVC